MGPAGQRAKITLKLPWIFLPKLFLESTTGATSLVIFSTAIAGISGLEAMVAVCAYMEIKMPTLGWFCIGATRASHANYTAVLETMDPNSMCTRFLGCTPETWPSADHTPIDHSPEKKRGCGRGSCRE